MINYVIGAIIIFIAAFGFWQTSKHVKGESTCCGGGGGSIRDDKKLDGPKIGEKEVIVEGMHCDNCRNSVERAVNRIDGAVCRVNLKKKLAVVSYSKPVADDEIRKAIEEAGYEVKSITQSDAA